VERVFSVPGNASPGKCSNGPDFLSGFGGDPTAGTRSSAMNKRTSKATVVDVARAAGVAVGTVSRVLNNHADVNADIRARVLESAQELNYSRIRQRKGRRHAGENGRHLGNIGIIFFGMEDTLVHLPVISSAVQGIESALSSKNRDLMLANIPLGDRVPPFMQKGRVEGLILKGPNQGELPPLKENELLHQIYRLPHVWLMGRLANARGDHCNFDTDAAARIVAEHLREHGHEHMAFFCPKPGQTQFERLKAAFLSAASHLDAEATVLEVEPPTQLAWPLPAVTHQDSVDALLDRWVQIPARARPTAFFVPSDRTAVQLYSALERRRLRVPRDVSIVSCNNERPLLMNLHPTVTTVDVRAEFVGRMAVEQLLWRIEHPDETPSVQLLVEPVLIKGDSVGAV
jgi:DNA-binding LacI/PurR family transcriptional regulator